MPYFFFWAIFYANSVDQGRTAPEGAVWCGSALFAYHFIRQVAEIMGYFMVFVWI